MLQLLRLRLCMGRKLDRKHVVPSGPKSNQISLWLQGPSSAPFIDVVAMKLWCSRISVQHSVSALFHDVCLGHYPVSWWIGCCSRHVSSKYLALSEMCLAIIIIAIIGLSWAACH